MLPDLMSKSSCYNPMQKFRAVDKMVSAFVHCAIPPQNYRKYPIITIIIYKYYRRNTLIKL